MGAGLDASRPGVSLEGVAPRTDWAAAMVAGQLNNMPIKQNVNRAATKLADADDGRAVETRGT